jgi:hypothetical protein
LAVLGVAGGWHSHDSVGVKNNAVVAG